MRLILNILRLLVIIGIPVAVGAGLFLFLKTTFLEAPKPESTEPVSFVV